MKKVQYENCSFFWDSSLTEERMRQISEWMGTLSKEQQDLLDDLVDDRIASATSNYD